MSWKNLLAIAVPLLAFIGWIYIQEIKYQRKEIDRIKEKMASLEVKVEQLQEK